MEAVRANLARDEECDGADLAADDGTSGFFERDAWAAFSWWGGGVLGGRGHHGADGGGPLFARRRRRSFGRCAAEKAAARRHRAQSAARRPAARGARPFGRDAQAEPQIPTYMNVRFLAAGDVWWFGGGFSSRLHCPTEEECVTLASSGGGGHVALPDGLYASCAAVADESLFLAPSARRAGGGNLLRDLNEGTAGVVRDALGTCLNYCARRTQSWAASRQIAGPARLTHE